jgi:hypothetical protein
VRRDGLFAERVEHVAFGPDGRALHLLAGVALHEEQGYARRGLGREAAAGGKRLGRGRVPADRGRRLAAHWFLRQMAGDEGGGEDRLTLLQRRRIHRSRFRRNLDFERMQAGDGLVERDRGAAVRPAAAERYVDAQAELAALGLRVVDRVQHLGREKCKVLEPLGRVVEHLRVDEREFRAPDSVGLHLLQFLQDLRLHHRRAEPPPAHHGAGFVGRVEEALPQGLDGVGARLRRQNRRG